MKNKQLKTVNIWMRNLLALLVSLSMLLSMTASRPLVGSADENPPTPTESPAVPVLDESGSNSQEETPVTVDQAGGIEPQATQAVSPDLVIPAAAPVSADKLNFRQIIIKFRPDSLVVISGDDVVAQTGTDLSTLQGLLAQAEVKPLFQTPSQAEVSDQGALPTSQYIFAQLPENMDFDSALAILDGIKTLEYIETAYMEPVYLPAVGDIPPATGSFVPQQGYLDIQDALHNGMDAVYAWTKAGGQGLNVRVYDIELGWQLGHEDLTINSSSLLTSSNSSQQAWVDHGTAVIGVIAGFNNPYGVTGVAPSSEIWLVSALMTDTLASRPLAEAINVAATHARAGDILVIPLQAIGPVTDQLCGCTDEECVNFEAVPVEYWTANFDAIKAATDKGVIVVEAAGTGAVNLDDAVYDGRFNPDSRDSGAILVGAGTSDTREPVCSANYGERVNVQGWGEDVVTTGYGDLFDGGGDPNQFYTAVFSGTSSASAMVAGAAASLQGVAKYRGYLLNPADMRDALLTNGTAQGGMLERHIGPLPNLKTTIDRVLPEVIHLLSPADASDVFQLRPSLDWEKYYGASYYQIQISTGSTFTTTVYDTTTSASDFTPTTQLVKNQPYWWRVRPYVNGVYLDWSEVWSFVPVSDAVAATTLLSPINGKITDDYTPIFTWKVPTIVPDGYQLQISTSVDFTTGVTTIDTVAADYTPAVDLAQNSAFYWRVRVRMGTSYSAWTGKRNLYTSLPLPSLDAPPDAGLVDTLRPLFDWSDIADSRAYHIQIAGDSIFSSTKIIYSVVVHMPTGETMVPSEYKTSGDLPRNRTLHWRIRVLGRYGWGPYTASSSILTGNPPSTPVLSSPSSLAVINGFDPDGPTLRWARSTNAPSGYEVEVSNTRDFSVPTYSDAPTDPFSVVSGLDPESVYYWRVRAVNLDGVYSNWSSVRVFYTTPPPPGSLIDPPDAATIDSLSPILDWDKVDVARSYKIQIAKDTAFTRLVFNSIITTSPPYTLRTALPRNTTLYWRVSAGGLRGYSKYTDYASFTTPDPPVAPELYLPADKVVLSTFTPTLDWKPSPVYPTLPNRDADEYQIQVATSSSFNPDPAITVIDEVVIAPETKYAIPAGGLPEADTYYWRVRAHNLLTNHYSAWSLIRSFTTPPLIRGKILNAMDGSDLEFANLQIQGTSWSTVSDSAGEFEFNSLPPGNYTLLITRNNFIRQTRKIAIASGENLVVEFEMAEIPAPDTMRIVLTWGKPVADLDTHLWLPSTNKSHIYKSDLGGLGGFPDAELTGDDADIYGTEVITIENFYAGKYQYAVYLNGTADQFILSQAVVTVYYGTTNKGTYSVPTTGTGNWWKLFTIDGTTKNLTMQNALTGTNPRPYSD